MSNGDFLFSGATPSSFTSQSVSSTNYPDWFQDAEKALIARGSAIASQPYSVYQGPRVAPLSQPQMDAQGWATNGQGYERSLIGQGFSNASRVANGFDSNQFNKYLQPYLSGANNELDTIAKLGTRNLTENILPAVNNGFIANGMFGSSRNGDFQQRALRDSNESILNQQSSVLNNAYNNAMSAYGQGQNTSLNAANAQGALGQLEQIARMNDVNTLNNVGNIAQQQQQKNLDTAYGDFQQQRDAPLNNLNMLSGLIRGYQPQAITSTYNTQPLYQNAQTFNPGATALGSLGALSSLGY